MITDQHSSPGSEDSRREAIIVAATRIFTERGFAGASNRAIAREAGVSPGLIYWYFEDKTDLFKEVTRRLFPLNQLETPGPPLEDIGLEALLEMIARQFLTIMTRPDSLRLVRLALNELISFPEVFQDVGGLIAERAIGPLAHALDARITRGQLPPVNTWLASQAFFGSLIGYVLRKHIFQSEDLQSAHDSNFIETVARIYSAGLTTGEIPRT